MVIGAILYYIVIQVVLWLGLNTNDLKMLQSLVVAMFLAVPFWKNKYFRKEKRREARTMAERIMLNINHIAKTFNPGTITEKR